MDHDAKFDVFINAFTTRKLQQFYNIHAHVQWVYNESVIYFYFENIIIAL